MARHLELITDPFFLVGAERSGSTLLRLMLDHHPMIAFHGEFEFAVDQIPEEHEWPNLTKYHDWIETNRVFGSSNFEVDQTLTYPALVNSFLVQKRNRANKPLVGATVHRQFDKLLRIWPEARFIHLLRDGRATALSCVRMGWAGNVWTGVEKWIDAEHLWKRMCEALTAEQSMEIKYEELLRDPQKTLTDLCDFFGVPYDKAMLEYHKTSTYGPPDPATSERWRTTLSNYEVQLLEARIGDMLTARGYALSGLPKLTVTARLKRQLRRQDFWARQVVRFRRYGLLLSVLESVTRRLGFKSVWKHLRRRMNEIELTLLK